MKFKTNKQIILATESPRRIELFGTLGLPFDVQASGITEQLEEEYRPDDLAIQLAYMKAEPIANLNPDAIVIAADTIVVVGNTTLGKPKTKQQAKMFLNLLSGKTHQVMTGVSVQHGDDYIGFVSSTEVKFYELLEEQIEAYVESEDPYDKAGGYGIQTLGGLFVQKINGDYNNVVGLPLSMLCRTLLLKKLIFIDKGEV